MNNKVLIVYVSGQSQSTKRLVEAMAIGADVKPVTVKEFQKEMLDKYSIVGFGSGIYWFKHNVALLKLAQNLPERKMETFIFSTHGSPFTGIYHRPLKKILKKKGYVIRGEFACEGRVTIGPLRFVGGLFPNNPSKGKAEKAKIFIRELMQ